MLRFCLCFLSLFYTVNSFSTEEKQEEKIKCYSCNENVMTIPKNNENNYTVEKPFASLSCIFNCKCNSFFLCKDCYEKKKKMAKCPKCKNNKKQSLENTNNNYKGLSCLSCFDAYKTSPLATCSFFYNCLCKSFICKECYEEWMIKEGKYKCPICKKVKNKKNKFDAMNEKNIINEEQKNCCQICTEYIKDFFIDC